jgi:hypothetical protein
MRPLITSALIAASLALVGNGAMAADTYAKDGTPAAPAYSAAHVAVRHPYPVARYGFAPPPVDVAQIIGSLLASPWLAPYVAHYGGRVPITHNSGGTYEPYDPDTDAMTASMAAAAAQTAADDAAETQQIMNNGGL